ncbi:unnamed protein product [Victoria cruziana]
MKRSEEGGPPHLSFCNWSDEAQPSTTAPDFKPHTSLMRTSHILLEGPRCRKRCVQILESYYSTERKRRSNNVSLTRWQPSAQVYALQYHQINMDIIRGSNRGHEGFVVDAHTVGYDEPSSFLIGILSYVNHFRAI